jgi:hypothetical protein
MAERHRQRTKEPIMSTISGDPRRKDSLWSAPAERQVADAPVPIRADAPAPHPSTIFPSRGVRSPALPRLSPGAAALLILRLFIGLGWLRAFAEKVIDPAWPGDAVSAFLGERLTRSEVALPPYESLVTAVFLPHATTLGWLIMAGQLLVGLGLTTGTLTRAALVGGLFMNLNFLLAGAPNPSAFYIIIQAALLATGAERILGVDAWRARYAAQPTQRTCRGASGRHLLSGTIGLCMAVAGYALLQADDLSPAGSVHDPAVLLAMLGGLTALWAVLTGGAAEEARDDRG